MIGTYSSVTDAVICIKHSESYTVINLVIMCCFYVHHIRVNKLLLFATDVSEVHGSMTLLLGSSGSWKGSLYLILGGHWILGLIDPGGGSVIPRIQ